MKDVGTYQAMVVGQLPQFLVAFRHVGGWQSSAGIVVWSFGVGRVVVVLRDIFVDGYDLGMDTTATGIWL